MSQGMLGCDIVIYRITYLWFSNERFCNKKRVLFVLDPVFYYYILLLLFSFLKLWLAGSTFRFLVLNLDRMKVYQNLQWRIHRSILLHLISVTYDVFQITSESLLPNHYSNISSGVLCMAACTEHDLFNACTLLPQHLACELLTFSAELPLPYKCQFIPEREPLLAKFWLLKLEFFFQDNMEKFLMYQADY